MYLVTADQMREMDRRTIETFGLTGQVLMENAGRSATDILFKKFPERCRQKVGIVAGKGNNGGDGFVIARYLVQKGVRPTVYLLFEKEKAKGDAALNLRLLDPLGLEIIEIPDQTAFAGHQSKMRHVDLWVDAILGTGLTSIVRGHFKTIIDFLNTSGKPIFSVDIPSGLNSDTGQVCGTCTRSATTVTFAFAKPGHILFPGATFTGNLEITDIGIPHHIAEAVAPLQTLITPDLITSYIQPRPADTHKGKTGHLLVIAGSPGKTGAAAMTALSAMRMGAGRVTLGISRSLNMIVEPQVLEAMTALLPETETGELDESAFDLISGLWNNKACMAIGPGIGTRETTQKLVFRIIETCPIPLVIDADGLNCLAGNTAILKLAKKPVIITPHPGEMATLINKTVADVQADRIGCAQKFARSFGVTVVLKGAGTVVATSDGRIFINPTGNPGMASAGMGDVLTGMIAGLITQGYAPSIAAQISVFVHGAAADTLAGDQGPVGFMASDVMAALPNQFRRFMVID